MLDWMKLKRKRKRNSILKIWVHALFEESLKSRNNSGRDYWWARNG